MLHLLLKIINPFTSIAVYNLKYETGKEILAKFGNSIKDLLNDMS